MADLTHLDYEPENPQDQSAFFQLPGEVRDRIYRYALASYDDDKRIYSKDTYWSRPQTQAPQTTNISLLQTCKRIYNEGRVYPWAARDHTFWLTDKLRAPQDALSNMEFAEVLNMIYASHGEVQLEHVRFFAQMYVLENGAELCRFLNLPHFHPRCVTISIRHTDWWEWERDAWLRIDSPWLERCKLPKSVRQFRMELETLHRKKDHLDSIVKQMVEKWYFTRIDGMLLSARNTPVEITEWKGSSTWNNERWIRDEIEPEILSYYVATVTWQYEPLITLEDYPTHPPPPLWLDPGASSHEEAERRTFDGSTFYRVLSSRLNTIDLKLACVPPRTPGREAQQMTAMLHFCRGRFYHGDDLHRQVEQVEEIGERWRLYYAARGHTLRDVDENLDNGGLEAWRARSWEWRIENRGNLIEFLASLEREAWFLEEQEQEVDFSDFSDDQ